MNLKSISAFIILGLLIGFGLGWIASPNRASQIIIDKNAKIGLPDRQNGGVADNDIHAVSVMGEFTASINGKAYYPKNCASANRIKEENRIWFETKEEAESEGYKPAQNCSGF